MERVIYNLPTDWSWVPLGQVATLLNGRAYKQAELLAEGPTPVLRVGNFFSNRSWYYSDLDLPADKYCEEGDLLYAWSASFGPKIWQGPKAIYHYHIWKILPSEHIDKKFLFYLLEKDSEDIKAQGNGVGMFHATKGGMEKMLVPLPPINEQIRIVEKLDALLTRIDTAIENLQESIRLADALFSSALNRVFNPSGTKVNFDSGYSLPEGWDWRTVNDLSTKIQYGHTAKAADKGNAQFLRITDIQDNNIDWLGVPFVDLKEKEIEKYALKDNDLVFARSGATAGKSILIKEPPQNAIFASYLIRIVPDTEAIQPEYLELFFKSPAYWDIVKANAAGAAQPNINGTKLGEFKVPTPSMETQKRIVDEMSSLSARVTELKKELRDKVYFIESAKSSILNSAFKGEL